MGLIAEQLVKLNQRDWLDIASILVPIILSIILLIQNGIISKRNEQLQKHIHNRDIANQAHDDILKIYRTYYDFCDTIYTTHFHDSVRIADIAHVSSSISNLFDLKRRILQNLDMAKMLFSREDPETYAVIEERFNSQIKAVDKYQDYILSGRLSDVAENAWNTILNNKSSVYASIVKYNFPELIKNSEFYNEYLDLCNTDEFQDIQKTMSEVMKEHNYDDYDKYFEKYLHLEKL